MSNIEFFTKEEGKQFDYLIKKGEVIVQQILQTLFALGDPYVSADFANERGYVTFDEDDVEVVVSGYCPEDNQHWAMCTSTLSDPEQFELLKDAASNRASKEKKHRKAKLNRIQQQELDLLDKLKNKYEKPNED